MSAKLPLRLLKTGQDAVDRALSALVTDLFPLVNAPFVRAVDVLVDNVTPSASSVILYPLPGTRETRDIRLLAGSTTVVQHRLGRAPLGRFVVYQSASASVYDVPLSSPYTDATRYLALACSANVTIRLVVY